MATSMDGSEAAAADSGYASLVEGAMNIEGLEKITLSDLQEIFAVNHLSIKQATPIMREFRDKHGLTDKQALHAFRVAQRIFDETQ